MAPNILHGQRENTDMAIYSSGKRVVCLVTTHDIVLYLHYNSLKHILYYTACEVYDLCVYWYLLQLFFQFFFFFLICLNI